MTPRQRCLALLLVGLGMLITWQTAAQSKPGPRLESPIPSWPNSGSFSTLFPDSDPYLQWIGHLGESFLIDALAIQGDYAFLSADPALEGEPPGLAVLDISDPDQPAPVGFLATGELVQDILLTENYALVQAGGLRILDISTPSQPFEVGQLAGQELAGAAWPHAYTLDPGGILRIYLISDPAGPLELGRHTLGEGPVKVHNAQALHLRGDGLHIWDLTDPAQAQEVGHFPVSGQADVSLAVAGTYAYLAWGECTGGWPWGCTSCGGSLLIIDISDPSAPALAGEIALGERVYGLWVAQGHAFLNTFWCQQIAHHSLAGYRLTVYDLSDPANPVLLPEHGKWIRDVAVKNTNAYLAFNNRGLEVRDLTAPYLEQIGGYGTAGPFYDVAVHEGHAYLGGNDLQIVDISEPTNPQAVSAYVTPGPVQRTVVKNGVAYVATSGGLLLLDVNNPAAPLQLGLHPLPGDATDVIIQQNIAYLTWGSCQDDFFCSPGGLRIVDVSDPTTPVELGSYDLPGLGAATGLALAEPLAYLIFGNCDYNQEAVECFGGLKVLDISNPAAPAEVGALDYAWGFSEAVVLLGDEVIVAAPGLHRVDVSDPFNPQEIESLGQQANSLIELHEIVYASWGECHHGGCEGGLHLYQLDQPLGYSVLGSYDAAGKAESVIVAGDLIFVSTEHRGLFILQGDYPISGQVWHPNQMPYPDVILSTSQGLTATTGMSGTYALSHPWPGSLTLSPVVPGFTSVPGSRLIHLPPAASGQNFTILPEPVTTTLAASAGATVRYTDTQGLPTILEFPAGAVTRTTTLTVTPGLAWGGQGLAFTGHAFEITATPGLRTFNAPLSATIHVSDLDLWAIPAGEPLSLYGRAAGGWVNGTAVCPEPVTPQRQKEAGIIQATLCSTGRYALLGPTHSQHFPFLAK